MSIIVKFTELNQYFAYLPSITSPTNNWAKFSNASLNSILLALTYGNIEHDPAFAKEKKLYAAFVKDY